MTKTIDHISTPKRSLIKALVYRLAITSVHFFIIWLILGQVTTSLYMTVIINIVSIVIYYINERVWVRIKWGKKKIAC